MTKMNPALEFWTLDEVAECLSISDDLSVRLWEILDACSNKTPMGGDGTNGTVETPDGRLDSTNDDKAPHWWNQLTPAQQTEINEAYAKYGFQ